MSRRVPGTGADSPPPHVLSDEVNTRDTTLTLYFAPGHRLGTVSTLIPLKDQGTPHMAVDSGGRLLNWVRNRAAYITPEHPDSFWFKSCISFAEKMSKVAVENIVDVVVPNPTISTARSRSSPPPWRGRPATRIPTSSEKTLCSGTYRRVGMCPGRPSPRPALALHHFAIVGFTQPACMTCCDGRKLK
jgi:hypothetical protein